MTLTLQQKVLEETGNKRCLSVAFKQILIQNSSAGAWNELDYAISFLSDKVCNKLLTSEKNQRLSKSYQTMECFVDCPSDITRGEKAFKEGINIVPIRILDAKL